MTPPLATALTTAEDVQLAGVPVPMTWSGWLVPTASPPGGTRAWPAGLPKSGTGRVDAGTETDALTARGATPLAANAAPPASTAKNPPKPPLHRTAPHATPDVWSRLREMFWRHLPALQEAIAELEQGNGEILVAM
jgi:hypothetical protein